MPDGIGVSVRARWAHLRFAVIGPLLANPPEEGDLQQRLQQLADSEWEHPVTGAKIELGFSTIERWYYAVRGSEPDPFGKLARKTRKDAGSHPTISVKLSEAIAELYRDHPTWQYKLHVDNLRALAGEKPELGSVPSCATVTRYMKSRGMLKQKKKRSEKSSKIQPRERRSWEVAYPNQLWHLDFHEAPRCVLTTDGKWVRPWLFGCMDDHSRLLCHLQWYLTENAENLIHGLSQAFLKRDVPRALLTDGGGAMKAGETRQGLMRSSVVHEMTLPETPEQNGKQENFWKQVDSRLFPMLEGVADLTLRMLNEATQAWVECEYHQAVHSETGQRPIDRFLQGNNLGRPCPSPEVLRDRFRIQTTRAQRRSDCTISVGNKRYELPTRFRALQRVTVRHARWSPSSVDLIDPETERILCTLLPLDRQRNADLARRAFEPVEDPVVAIAQESPRRSGVAPLLSQYIADYAATGQPPAYIPKDECDVATGPSTAEVRP